MASPVPYSTPKRRLLNKNTVKFATDAGSFVYAPADGRLYPAKNGIVIKTEGGFLHTLSDVVATKPGKYIAGERIGRARGKSVIYTKRNKVEGIVDAMPVVLRKDGPKPKEWMPGAAKKPSDGAGQMGPGNELKVVWHTSESPNDSNAIHGVVNWVKQQSSEYTIAWNPYTGQLVQMFPATAGARAVMNGYNIAANRHGKVCIQVCVIGRAANAPLVKSPMKGRRELMEWLDSWGIPRKNITNNDRSVQAWTQSGHTTHRSAPKPNDHTDPGPIDFKKLFAP